MLPLVLPPGPLNTDFINNQINTCYANGIWNILFIQNFFKVENICLPHTWLFCVELQLTLICIPLMIIYNKQHERFKKALVLILFLVITISMLFNAMVVYVYKLPPTLLWTLPDPEQRNYYYFKHFYKPWTHLSVFCIGFIAGILSRNHEIKIRENNNSMTHASGWIASLIVMFSLIFGCYDWVTGELPQQLVSAVFDSLHRCLWALANSWIFFAVTSTGTTSKSQNSLARLFSHPFLIATGKLSLLAYLFHPLLQTAFLSTQQQALYSSFILMGYVLIGNVILAHVLSFIFYLLFDFPICASLLNTRIIPYDYNSQSEEKPELRQFGNNMTNNLPMSNNQIALSVLEQNRVVMERHNKSKGIRL